MSTATPQRSAGEGLVARADACPVLLGALTFALALVAKLGAVLVVPVPAVLTMHVVDLAAVAAGLVALRGGHRRTAGTVLVVTGVLALVLGDTLVLAGVFWWAYR